jgi:hypothetical protein
MARHFQLEKPTQSHVKLMTECKLAWSRHKEFVEEQNREWERQQERWKQHDRWRQEEKERGVELDRRIAQLVSGIGEFIREHKK